MFIFIYNKHYHWTYERSIDEIVVLQPFDFDYGIDRA